MLLWSWFNILSEQANRPVTGVSLLSAMPVIVSGAGFCFKPVISTYCTPT
jgi:hypothetical protein